MSEWISVKDKLPEEFEEVLTFGSGEYEVLSFLDTKAIGKCWEDKGGWWRPFDEVTHWMPLPEPPGEAGE